MNKKKKLLCIVLCVFLAYSFVGVYAEDDVPQENIVEEQVTEQEVAILDEEEDTVIEQEVVEEEIIEEELTKQEDETPILETEESINTELEVNEEELVKENEVLNEMVTNDGDNETDPIELRKIVTLILEYAEKYPVVDDITKLNLPTTAKVQLVGEQEPLEGVTVSADDVTITYQKSSETTTTSTFPTTVGTYTVTWAINNQEYSGDGQDIVIVEDAVQHTITYVIDEYTTNSTDNKATYWTSDADFDLKEPTKPGYVFMGWYETSTFSGDAITEIDTASNKDYTLYPKFIMKGDFNDNGEHDAQDRAIMWDLCLGKIQSSTYKKEIWDLDNSGSPDAPDRAILWDLCLGTKKIVIDVQ